MRKKSHISLAQYLVEDMKVPEMMEHRLAFCLGSILPDCKPSFLTRRHEFGETFEMVKLQIRDLAEAHELLVWNAGAYMRRLGEVLHYLADYFTFPHNRTYDGNLKDHCFYEKELKFELRDYVSSGGAFRDRQLSKSIETTEELLAFIQEAHEEYLSEKRSVQEDCRYIVRVCRQVAEAILGLLSRSKNRDERLCQAA